MMKPDWRIRRIERTDERWMAALHVALGVPTPTGERCAPDVQVLLDQASRRSWCLDPLVVAFHKGRMAMGCVAVVYPGASALLLSSGERATTFNRPIMADCVRTAASACFQSGVRVVEILGETRGGLGGIADAAGFRFITSLSYQRARVSGAAIHRPAPPFSWRTYQDCEASLFEAALSDTYAESKDCPELAGLRSVAEVLDTHRAAGEFDPDNWCVVQRGSKAIGVLLLAHLTDRSVMEVEYIGVVPAERGTGVGDALLNHAFGRARDVGVRNLALAVDRRNGPARRLYQRWGFVEVGVRAAWIATVDSARV